MNKIINVKSVKDLDNYTKLDKIITKAKEINELINSLKSEYGMYVITIYGGEIKVDTPKDKFFECKVHIGVDENLEDISRLLDAPISTDAETDTSGRVVTDGVYFVDLYYNEHKEEEKK